MMSRHLSPARFIVPLLLLLSLLLLQTAVIPTTATSSSTLDEGIYSHVRADVEIYDDFEHGDNYTIALQFNISVWNNSPEIFDMDLNCLQLDAQVFKSLSQRNVTVSPDIAFSSFCHLTLTNIPAELEPGEVHDWHAQTALVIEGNETSLDQFAESDIEFSYTNLVTDYPVYATNATVHVAPDTPPYIIDLPVVVTSQDRPDGWGGASVDHLQLGGEVYTSIQPEPIVILSSSDENGTYIAFDLKLRIYNFDNNEVAIPNSCGAVDLALDGEVAEMNTTIAPEIAQLNGICATGVRNPGNMLAPFSADDFFAHTGIVLPANTSTLPAGNYTFSFDHEGWTSYNLTMEVTTNSLSSGLEISGINLVADDDDHLEAAVTIEDISTSSTSSSMGSTTDGATSTTTTSSSSVSSIASPSSSTGSTSSSDEANAIMLGWMVLAGMMLVPVRRRYR